MARMIPLDCPPETRSVAERKLFAAFRDGLSSKYTVIHSLPWLSEAERGLAEGECDFLVLHPSRGMLAVEAKSGEVAYDGSKKAWAWCDSGKNFKDPYDQAQRSVRKLNVLLSERVPGWAKAAVPFGHSVAFPGSDQVRGDWPLHTRREITFLRSDLSSFQAKVESVLGCYKESDAPMPRQVFDRALTVLQPIFKVVRSLAAKIRDEEDALLRLTAEQSVVLGVLGANRRVIIEGVAGSGKTLLAVQHARNLAAEGARVLLVCFNIPLAGHLRGLLEGSGADVHHFHGLCERAVKETGGEWRAPSDAEPFEDRQEFWNRTSCEMLVDAISDWKTRYDAVVADEGQDFCEDWWPTLELLLADEEKGRFCVLRDERQDLYGRNAEVHFHGATCVPLLTNCRNTAKIAEFVHKQGGVSEARPHELAPEGTAPEVTTVTTEEAQREAVAEIVRRLTSEEGVSPDRIVILGDHTLANSPFKEDRRIGDLEVVGDEEEPGPGKVIYATAHRYKGLEADCAILCLRKREGQEERHRQMLYVAGSRARFCLHVVVRA